MPVIVAISGTKNTGKTTLITRLIPQFAKRGLKTAVIKHDGHDFEADVAGTDSWLHKQAGAFGTAVFSSKKFMIVKEQPHTKESELIAMFPEADVILLEGFKYSEYPKVELIRQGISEGPVCDPETVLAYVTDVLEPRSWQTGLIPCFRYDEIEALAEFLLKHL